MFPDGTVYKGQVKDGQRHGFGIQVWPDGAKYEGMWRDNVACGRGKFFHIDGDVYDGKISYLFLFIIINLTNRKLGKRQSKRFWRIQACQWISIPRPMER